MLILKSYLLSKYPDLVFGFSTKVGLNRKAPYYFNLSKSVGEDENLVAENRRSFFSTLGLDHENIVFQKQVHSDIVTYVVKRGICGESDAVITNKKGLGLAVSTADCVPVFLYDPRNKVIAGIHSGWKGTQKKILFKTLQKLKTNFNCSPEELAAYIGPSICRDYYEVGEEVASQFDSIYLLKRNNKVYLDLPGANYDMMLDFGMRENNIQMSSLCTYEMKSLLHSYRRDGIKSGRAIGVIAMKAAEEGNNSR